MNYSILWGFIHCLAYVCNSNYNGYLTIATSCALMHTLTSINIMDSMLMYACNSLYSLICTFYIASHSSPDPNTGTYSYPLHQQNEQWLRQTIGMLILACWCHMHSTVFRTQTFAPQECDNPTSVALSLVTRSLFYGAYQFQYKRPF